LRLAKQQIRTQHVAEPVAHFSPAVSIEAKGKLVFISGMTARRPDTSRRSAPGAHISQEKEKPALRRALLLLLPGSRFPAAPGARSG
jgi:enamine deaminase RidA (YjgF/YER057c/UK114 family)